MFDQLKALLALKTQLFWRTFRGAQAVSTVLHVGALILVLLLGCGIGVGLFFLCSEIHPDRPGPFLLFGADIVVALFLFLWLTGLLMEIQRSDVVDFRKMLYLPVSLRMIFMLNYGASLFAPILFIFVPAVIGASLGLTMKMGYRMLLVIPLGAVFYLTVGAWSYYVQGILAALMENKRRRRTIIAVATITMILLPQLPNLFNTSFLRQNHSSTTAFFEPYLNAHTLVVVNQVIPVGWLPWGIHALATGANAEVALSFLAMSLLTAGGLALGLHSTWRYYTAAGGRKTRQKKDPTTLAALPAQTAPHQTLIERRIPLVDEETSTLAMAGILSYARHPQMRMLLIMPFVLALIFGGTFLARSHGNNAISIPIVMLSAVLIPFLNLAVMMNNAFGLDANGFRVYVLLPTDRKKYLVGKNLAMIPFLAVTAFPLVIMAALLDKASFSDSVIALLQVPSLFLVFCVVGNLLSVRFPYRMQTDGIQKKRVGGAAGLMNLLVFPLLALMAIPSWVCMLGIPFVEQMWGYRGVSLGLLASLIYLGGAFCLYRLALEPTGRLMHRREQKILSKFQHDKE